MKKTNLNQRVSQGMGGAMILFAATPCLYAAEPIIATPPPPSTTPAWTVDESTNNAMQVFAPSSGIRQNSDEPFQWGPVTFRPHVNYNLSYGNGVEYTTNHTTSTVIQSISPGMTVDLGRHWSADYTPTLTYYSSSKFSDTLNHSASLTGATSYGDWLLGLSQTWNLSSAPLAETAAQTEQQNFNTGLSASYVINDHFSTDLGVNQDFNYVTGGQDSKTWSTMDWLNYSFWKRLAVGAGVGGGYTDTDPDGSGGVSNGDQTFEQLQGRINWRATDRLSLSLTGGFEYLQFDTPGIANSFSPIFSAAIQYQPFAQTQLALSASRTVSSSDYFILSQTTETTAVTLSLNQRLLKEFNLTVSGGYTKTEYTESLLGIGPHPR